MEKLIQLKYIIPNDHSMVRTHVQSILHSMKCVYNFPYMKCTLCCNALCVHVCTSCVPHACNVQSILHGMACACNALRVCTYMKCTACCNALRVMHLQHKVHFM